MDTGYIHGLAEQIRHRDARAADLRDMTDKLTQLRDRAAADGNLTVAEDAIDSAHAVMDELRQLYR